MTGEYAVAGEGQTLRDKYIVFTAKIYEIGEEYGGALLKVTSLDLGICWHDQMWIQSACVNDANLLYFARLLVSPLLEGLP